MNKKISQKKQLEIFKKQKLDIDITAINYILEEYKKRKCSIEILNDLVFNADLRALNSVLDKVFDTIRYNSSETELKIFVNAFINKYKSINKENEIKASFELGFRKFLSDIIKVEMDYKFDLRRISYSNIIFNGARVDGYANLMINSFKILSDESIGTILDLGKWSDKFYAAILANCKLSSSVLDKLVNGLLKSVEEDFNDIVFLINDKEGPNHEKIKDKLIDCVSNKGGCYASGLSIENLNEDQTEDIFNKLSDTSDSFSYFVSKNIELWSSDYLTKIFKLFVTKGDMYNFYDTYKLLKVNAIEIIADDDINSYLQDMTITSENVGGLYDYLLLSGCKNKNLIEKIKASGNVKYIVLTAIYIDKSLFTELFDDNMTKCLCYINNNPSFSDEDMIEIINNIFDNDKCEKINKKTDSKIQKLVDKNCNKGNN